MHLDPEKLTTILLDLKRVRQLFDVADRDNNNLMNQIDIREDLPLAGIRVVDFSGLLPGPLATLMLRRAGAEVIKIESPGGDAMRTLPDDGGRLFSILNRGKRSVCVDLKDARQKTKVIDLLAGADVVVEQFRPGVADKLGIGYADCRKRRDDIVYCSISGFGQSGPMRGFAGHDINYLAHTGMLDLFAGVDGPVPPPMLLADVIGGAYPAFNNIVLALYKRLRNGAGSYIDIAMTNGLHALNVPLVAQTHPSRESEPQSALQLDGSTARYRCYCCADGGWIAVGALEEKFWRRLCQLIELNDGYGSKNAADPQLIKAVAERFHLKSRHEWLQLFAGEDVCCNAVRDFADGLAEVVDARDTSLELPLAAQFDDDEIDHKAPALGEGNREFLA